MVPGGADPTDAARNHAAEPGVGYQERLARQLDSHSTRLVGAGFVKQVGTDSLNSCRYYALRHGCTSLSGGVVVSTLAPLLRSVLLCEEPLIVCSGSIQLFAVTIHCLLPFNCLQHKYCVPLIVHAHSFIVRDHSFIVCAQVNWLNYYYNSNNSSTLMNY